MAILLVAAAGCARPSAPEAVGRTPISDGWLAMGTFFEAELRVRPVEQARAHAWLAWARTEIARLEKVYSRHDPESNVSALNRALARDDVLRTGVRIDADLESILFTAVEVWEGSGGAFDVTVGPLVDVWTRAARLGQWPSVDALRRAKRHVGSEGLLLVGGGELGLTKPAMRIDLDAISKGAVLDRLRERLESDLPGVAALLSLGESSLLAIGDPGDGAWRLVVRPNESSTGEPIQLEVRDRAVSMSSSIGRVSEIAGERVSHVVDPRTGSVIRKTVEAIVVADRAAIADAWSTALLVVGANRAAQRLIDRADIEASVSESSGRSVATEGWERIASRQPAGSGRAGSD